MDLIHRRGYGAVGVQEICQRAGVRPGSFYHFFRSKRDLLLTVIEHVTQGHRGRRALVEQLPPLKRIETLFRVTAEHHAAIADATGNVQGCAIANLSLELSAHDEVVRERLVANFNEWLGFFDSTLRDGIAAGELPPIDTRRGAEVLLAHLEGALVLAKTYNSPGMLDRLCAQAVELVRQLPPAQSEESDQPWSA
jgi:TetR/AcrR family transcriptional repressor of nem operon